MPPNSKVALVIDALPILGGSEKVLMAALELFPDAPIYSLLYNRDIFLHTPIARQQVFTSFIEHLPLKRTHYRKYLPLMPFAIRRFDLRKYDTILSFSYAVAHGVKVQNGQKHLSYTFTPMRYAWRDVRLDGMPNKTRSMERIFRPFRSWDVSAATSVDQFAAVSSWIADWVTRVYRQNATVIYPPVDVERFSPQPERGSYFIALSRLVPHKRVELIVDAFNDLGLPLLIIGEGDERQRLERRAKDNIRFLGFQSDRQVNELLNRGRAFVCACEEDFGIAMVEAQAAGCPVIAYGEGGACEIVVENRTGLFFDEPCYNSLVQAVERFLPLKLSSAECAENAARFNKRRFLSELDTFVNQNNVTCKSGHSS